jgi:hypothetical protein
MLMDQAWPRLAKFIEDFNNHACMKNPDEDGEFLNVWELEMAKAFVSDWPQGAVRVSKIILALKDVNDIKIKID